MIVQNTAWQVEAYQTSNTSSSATYTLKVSRIGSKFWGAAKVAVHDHNGHVIYWAAPEKSKWKYDSTNKWWLGSTSNRLDWRFWNPEPGYITASSLTYTRTVGISRGNNRQGSKTISVGIKSTLKDWTDTMGSLTLTTTKVADVSGVSFSVKQSDKNANPRTMDVSMSFNNPENYYTGYIYHNGSLLQTITSTGAAIIHITNAMFNTNQRFQFIIKGKDGVTYVDKSASIYIEPSGVGIWYNQNGTAKEVFHAYYKNNSGDIIEVTEAWARKNNLNIKTVK